MLSRMVERPRVGVGVGVGVSGVNAQTSAGAIAYITARLMR